MRERVGVWIHPTADVADSADLGAGTKVWNECQIRENARVGMGCVLGKDVYVDVGVEIGDNVKIQNGAQLFSGLTVESGVFIGPGAIFANDKVPRAINPDGSPKRAADWDVGRIRLCFGSSIGAAAVVIPDVTVGAYAVVGAAAVVTRDVPAHALVVGSPARQVGSVCKCGRRLTEEASGRFTCSGCGDRYDLDDVQHVKP